MLSVFSSEDLGKLHDFYQNFEWSVLLLIRRRGYSNLGEEHFLTDTSVLLQRTKHTYYSPLGMDASSALQRAAHKDMHCTQYPRNSAVSDVKVFVYVSHEISWGWDPSLHTNFIYVSYTPYT